MKSNVLWRFIALVMVAAMALSACGPTATPTPQATAVPQATSAPATQAPTQPPASQAGQYQIPDVEQGKFNVAFVLIGPHDDGGWSQAHAEGITYVQQNVPNVHTAYIENVAEGTDSEQVFRSLSRKGFNLIFGTSFGYMDPMETVAAEFPDITYIHISGYKSNSTPISATCLAPWKI